MFFSTQTEANGWHQYFQRTTRSAKIFLRLQTTLFKKSAISKLMKFSWSETENSQGVLQFSGTHTLQMWTCTSWSRWRGEETSSQERHELFQYDQNKGILFKNWQAQRRTIGCSKDFQLYHKARGHHNSTMKRKKNKLILERHLCDDWYRQTLSVWRCHRRESQRAGPSYRRTTTTTRHNVSRTWTLVNNVFLEADDSKWSKHRCHRRAPRLAESHRMASRTCSSTKRQHSHATQNSNLQWWDQLATWDEFKLVVNKTVNIVLFSVFRTEDPSAHAKEREDDTMRLLVTDSAMMDECFTIWAGGAEKHFAARMFSSAVILCASAALCSARSQTDGDWTQLFKCAVEKSLARLAQFATVHTFFLSLSRSSQTSIQTSIFVW